MNTTLESLYQQEADVELEIKGILAIPALEMRPADYQRYEDRQNLLARIKMSIADRERKG